MMDDTQTVVMDESDDQLNTFKEMLKSCNLNCMKKMMVLLENSLDAQKVRDAHAQKNIDDFIDYYPNSLSSEDVLMHGIKAELMDLKTNQLKSSNKDKTVSTYFGPVPYEYAGVSHKAQSFEGYPNLQKWLALSNERYGEGNAMNITYMPSEKAFLSLHSDDEEVIDQSSPISTLSIGDCIRDVDFFQKFSRGRHVAVKSLTVEEGSVYVMKEGCQGHFKHRVTATKKFTGERFSLSIRNVHTTAPSVENQLKSQTQVADCGQGKVATQLPHASLIIGTSIEVPLKADKLAKGKHNCVLTFHLVGPKYHKAAMLWISFILFIVVNMMSKMYSYRWGLTILDISNMAFFF